MDASRGFVLVIDEDERIRETTARWFEEQGYRVASANGEAGVQIARCERPDVILLDAEMPSRRGYETLERLKFAPASRNIPVVVCRIGDSILNETKALHETVLKLGLVVEKTLRRGSAPDVSVPQSRIAECEKNVLRHF